jgi:RNA polymerase sigma-70 factor (ECF subfamily)
LACAFLYQAAREKRMQPNDPHHLRPLLERALAGDVQAWNEFFVEIRRFLHAELQRASTPDDAGLDHSSVVQFALLQAWKRIETQFPNGVEEQTVGRFLKWVKKIIHNRRFDKLRQERRRKTKPAGSGLGAVPDLRAPSGQPERVDVALTRALARLPEKKRQVVEMFWFEGLSDAQISERVGCSAGAVRVLRFRALRELRSPELLTLLEE